MEERRFDKVVKIKSWGKWESGGKGLNDEEWNNEVYYLNNGEE